MTSLELEKFVTLVFCLPSSCSSFPPPHTFPHPKLTSWMFPFGVDFPLLEVLLSYRKTQRLKWIFIIASISLSCTHIHMRAQIYKGVVFFLQSSPWDRHLRVGPLVRPALVRVLSIWCQKQLELEKSDGGGYLHPVPPAARLGPCEHLPLSFWARARPAWMRDGHVETGAVYASVRSRTILLEKAPFVSGGKSSGGVKGQEDHRKWQKSSECCKSKDQEQYRARQSSKTWGWRTHFGQRAILINDPSSDAGSGRRVGMVRKGN